MRSRLRPGALLLVLLLAHSIGAGSHALALSDEELFRGFPFGFIGPGARAVSLGGAFTGLADDATAAYYNPAGLHFLTAPDVYVEMASLSPDPQSYYFSTGSTEVDPVTGPVGLPFLQVSGTDDPDSLLEVSFISFAWPFQVGGGGRRLIVSGSRQVVISSQRTLPLVGGPSAEFAFDTFPNTVVGSDVEVYSVATATAGNLSLGVTYWNAGISYDIDTDFSLGLTLSYAELDIAGASVTNIVDPLQLFLDPTHPRLGAAADQDIYGTQIDGTDSDLAWTIGLHWHPDSVFPSGRSPWGMGVVYRKGASFSVPEQITFNAMLDGSFNNQIVIPDQYAFGVSYRTPEHWTFSADYLRVEYSDMLAGYQSGVNYLTSARLANGAYEVSATRPVEVDVDDVNVPRVGAEFRYAFGGSQDHLFRVAAGYYRSGDPRIRMTSYNSLDTAVNEAYQGAFAGGDTVEHVTAGLGLVWDAFGFELSGDSSDLGTQILGSFTFRLERTNGKGKP